MEYLIISYATAGSAYEQCIQRQHEQHGKRFRGFVFHDQGSWAKNTKLKVKAIREGLKQADCVLWIDADCTVDPPGDLPAGDWDIGIVDNIHPTHKNRISAGFILFRNTPATHRMLDHWEMRQQYTATDHGALTMALKESRRATIINISDWLEGRHSINELLPERGAYVG